VGLVLAISGLHGSGKSTYARALAKAYGLRLVSAGRFFRRIASEKGMTIEQLTEKAGKDPNIDRLIDYMTKQEAEKGDVVLDGQLSGWMAGNKADMKIFLTAPDDVRFRRIAMRDGISFEEARRQTLMREAAQKERFLRYYGIDTSDLSRYDLVFDTSLHPLEENIKILKNIISEYLAEKSKK
jgi:cytidylate kinase